MSHERHMGWGWGGARRCGWVGGPRCVCKHESEGEGEGESEQSQSGAPVKLRPAPGWPHACLNSHRGKGGEEPGEGPGEGRGEGRGEGVGGRGSGRGRAVEQAEARANLPPLDDLSCIWLGLGLEG